MSATAFIKKIAQNQCVQWFRSQVLMLSDMLSPWQFALNIFVTMGKSAEGENVALRYLPMYAEGIAILYGM